MQPILRKFHAVLERGLKVPLDLLNAGRAVAVHAAFEMVIKTAVIEIDAPHDRLFGVRDHHLRVNKTGLPLKHPTGAFVASQTRTCWGVPAPNPASYYLEIT